MIEQNFSLQPFFSENLPSDLQIRGQITRQKNIFTIHYELLDPLAGLLVPTPTDQPTRQYELWQSTCFEFFLAVKHSPQYWEFNLSPAGDWNVYNFSDYRQRMKEEIVFNSLPFAAQVKPNYLSLFLALDLNKIIQENQVIEVAISAVIQLKNGDLIYWALTHPGPQADFHQRDSFTIEM